MVHSKAQYKLGQPVNEALEAMHELTGNAYKLLAYYYTKHSRYRFNDQEIAETVGVELRTLKKLKKELQDNKYLLIIKGPKIDNYFIGRTEVTKWEAGENDE